MELRRRQTANSSSGSRSNSLPRSPESKGAKIDRNFTRCIILSILVLFTACLAPFFLLSKLPESARQPFEVILDMIGLEAKAHAVVIDAGSTGSRVLAFTFKRDFFDGGGGQLKLEDELWLQVKPGLSSFAEDPLKAGGSIEELIKAAKGRIPERYWSKTPITLKATAGLRLLPASQSEAILGEVKKVLENSGFKPDKNTLIEIMNPMEEGLYAWFTVNYLLGAFGPDKPIWKSAVSLDLGGGSTQITFAPKKFPVPGIEGRKHFIHKVDILEGNPLQVYSHSYLGLGLMAA
jgi:ectonucleoside triphosphate diphosphohydrolase 5/6